MTYSEEAYADYKQQLGLRIARLRQEKGMSQRTFALVLELDRVTLNHIESGKANPTLGTLARIAQGLDIRIEELLGTTGAQQQDR